MELVTITAKAVEKLNKAITDEVFLTIQNDSELMHEYLIAVGAHGHVYVNQKIGKEVKALYHLVNSDTRNTKPKSTLIKSYQEFK